MNLSFINNSSAISLVIPVFNEAADLSRHIKTILEQVAPLKSRYELEVLLIDDGSRDATWKEVQVLESEHPEIVGISFTRNFGKEAALMAGIEHAKGAAVIIMDSDLQHPPEFIVEMVEHWEQGSKVVEMRKSCKEKQSVFYKVSSGLFYQVLKTMSQMDLRDNSDFKLLDREVIDCLLALPEKQRFFRGLVQWLGYPTSYLTFAVPERTGGVSKWNFIRLARYALDNVTSFTAWPLYFAGWVGAIVTAIGLVFVSIAIFQKIAGVAETGFTTVISLIVLFGGLNLLVMGFIGFYLARVFDEVKGRPRYVICSASVRLKSSALQAQRSQPASLQSKTSDMTIGVV